MEYDRWTYCPSPLLRARFPLRRAIAPPRLYRSRMCPPDRGIHAVPVLHGMTAHDASPGLAPSDSVIFTELARVAAFLRDACRCASDTGARQGFFPSRKGKRAQLRTRQSA